MCQPVNSPANRAEVRLLDIPAGKIGSCGRRCSECPFAVMTAGLAIAPGGRMAPAGQQSVRA